MQTFQIFRPKVSPTLPQNIRHAATALTGMGCSVAVSFGAILCIRHADKKRHIDRTVPHHPQHRRLWCAWLRDLCGGVAASLRGVGKLRSVHGAKNLSRLIMVQGILSQPMIVLSTGVGELTLLTETQMAVGIETSSDAECIGRHFSCIVIHAAYPEFVLRTG